MIKTNSSILRVLEVAANHFLENNFSKEQFDKGLGLLRRAVGILENEGRPAQAGNLAMKMLSLGLNSEIVGSEMTDLGKTCLKMLVMTNNVMMTGNCLILTTLLFIKHFENVALDEIKLLYRDNAGNVSKEVQEFMKTIIKALEDRNFTKIEETQKVYSNMKADKTTRNAVKTAMSNILNEVEHDRKDDEKRKSYSTSPTFSVPKAITVAAGAALVASSISATKYNKSTLKDGR